MNEEKRHPQSSSHLASGDDKGEANEEESVIRKSNGVSFEALSLNQTRENDSDDVATAVENRDKEKDRDRAPRRPRRSGRYSQIFQLFASPPPESDQPFDRRVRRASARRSVNYDSLIRPEQERHAMQRVKRVWKTVIDFFTICPQNNPHVSSSHLQYRIPPREEVGLSMLDGLKEMLEGSIVNFTTWNFRADFVPVMLLFFIIFFAYVFVFTFIIYGVVNSYHKNRGAECLDGWDYDEPKFGKNFEMSFSLSWTTLSTVGFGTVSPPAYNGCMGIRFLCAIEAFVGVLYAGFCGAILFAKVMMLHAQAHVTFSSAICLQFGEGVSDSPLDIDQCLSKDDDQVDVFNEAREVLIQPCPFLEFRVVNDSANRDLGEILEASMECVATVIRGPSSLSHQSSDVAMAEFVNVVEKKTYGVREKVPLAKRLYHKLKIDPEEHPYFRHAWYCRHVLDESSPLVKSDIREFIARHGGWPADINDYSKIRECLLQNGFRIIVTFNGTDRLTASSCFKVKRYLFEDVYVGWQFAGLYYRTEDEGDHSQLKVDLSLIHDILPQKGGGNEPLGSRAPTTSIHPSGD